LKLYQDGNQVGSDYTVTTGYYEFTDICPGTYEIRATSSNSTGACVNTTDAAQTNYFGAVSYEIEKVRFHAGDVGTSGETSNLTVNATDAGRIQANFVYGTVFDDTWSFWKTNDMISINSTTESYPSITLSVGSDLDADMYGLCTGDFNCSFVPGAKKAASATLDLIYAGNRQVSSNQEFDLPLRMVNAASVGAVSLILDYPGEFVEVQDVLMNNTGGRLDWSARGGNELRIGWNSPVPLYLVADAELLILKLKTTDAFTKGASIKFALASDPLNELADAQYNVIGNAVLGVDVIDASAVEIEEQPARGGLTLSSHPNPFSGNTMITYNLPFTGKITLEINSIMGVKMTTLVNETQPEGTHMVKFDMYNLNSGIYTATLKLITKDDVLIRTIKLVNNR